MKINYCLPIIKHTKKEILETLDKNSTEYQYFEIWLEQIEDLDDQFITAIIKKLKSRVIFLFKRGENIPKRLTNEKKAHLLALTHNTDCFFDIDLSETVELAYIKKEHLLINTIISFHDYKETPVTLPEIIKRMDTLTPAVYKIATMCTDQTDGLKLLLLQQNLLHQNKKHIILGMGKFGTITRVFGTLFGNELIYAPVTHSEESAPGQLTKKELEIIFAQLQKK